MYSVCSYHFELTPNKLGNYHFGNDRLADAEYKRGKKKRKQKMSAKQRISEVFTRARNHRQPRSFQFQTLRVNISMEEQINIQIPGER